MNSNLEVNNSAWYAWYRLWFLSGARTPLHSFQFTEIAFCLFSLQRLHFVYSSVHLRQETFVGERAFWAMSILKQFEREANTV